jgi:hypothetical protein
MGLCPIKQCGLNICVVVPGSCCVSFSVVIYKCMFHVKYNISKRPCVYYSTSVRVLMESKIGCVRAQCHACVVSICHCRVAAVDKTNLFFAAACALLEFVLCNGRVPPQWPSSLEPFVPKARFTAAFEIEINYHSSLFVVGFL